MRGKLSGLFRVASAVASVALLAGVSLTVVLSLTEDEDDSFVRVFSMYVGEDFLGEVKVMARVYPSILRIDDDEPECQFDRCQNFSIELRKANVKVGEVPLKAWSIWHHFFDGEGRRIGLFDRYLEGRIVDPPSYDTFVLIKGGAQLQELAVVDRSFFPAMPDVIAVNIARKEVRADDGTIRFTYPLRFTVNVINPRNFDLEYQVFWRYGNGPGFSVIDASFSGFPRSEVRLLAPGTSEFEIDLRGMIPKADWAQVSVVVFAKSQTNYYITDQDTIFI